MQEQITMPKDHYKSRVGNQYGNVAGAIAREVLQNSTDAGAKRIDFTIKTLEDGRTHWTAKDNGCGMGLDTFRAVMLHLGGSRKPAGAVGGFGAAKELLLYAQDKWTCKGQGFEVNGEMASPPESKNGETSGVRKGFEVNGVTDLVTEDELYSAVFELCQKSKLSAQVYVNGTQMPKGRTLRSNQVIARYDWGVLYVHKGVINWQDYDESGGYLHIRINGLFSAMNYVGGGYAFYIEVTAPSTQVMQENRDYLKPEYFSAINRDIRALVSHTDLEGEKPDTTVTVFGKHFNQVEKSHPELGEYTLEGIGNPEPKTTAISVTDDGVEPIRRVHDSETELPTSGAMPTSGAVPTSGAMPTSGSEEFSGSLGNTIEVGSPEYRKLATRLLDGKISMGEAVDKVEKLKNKRQPQDAWKKPYGVVNKKKRQPKVYDDEGFIKPKFAKALEIVNVAAGLVCEAVNIPAPIPGLVFSDDALGICVPGDGETWLLSGDPDHVLKSNPFAVLDTIIHETAHYNEPNHQLSFEIERSRIARACGDYIHTVLGVIETMQAQSFKEFKGEYWL